METVGWLPIYVARCPVRLFEAAGGTSLWLPKGAAGEFCMRPLGNAELLVQLRNVLDDKILFEHIVRNPNAFIILSQRFFVIRLENGSFRGFGFDDFEAAREIKEQVQKAVKPHILEEHDERNPISPLATSGTDTSSAEKPRGSSTIPPLSPQEQASSVPSLELVTFSRRTKSSKWKLSWKRLTSFSYLRNWNAITEALGWQEHEMEIGFPTDVKHVAHIGWDGPSVCGPSWVDELKTSSDFAMGPLKEFGQPAGSDWIHDALSAAKWTSPGLEDHSCTPPAPPAEFLDSAMTHLQKKHSRWNVIWLMRKPRTPSVEKLRT